MSKPENNPEMQENAHLCPICHKPAAEKFRPFCSKRCADIDLAHWLRGDYAVVAEEQDGIEEVWEDMASGGSQGRQD